MRTSSVLFVIFLLCTNSLPLNFRKLDSNHHKVIIDRIKVEFFNGEPSLEKLEELYAKVEKLLEEAKVQQTRHNQMYIENEKRCKKEHVEKQALIDTDTSAIETAELEKIECENTLKQIKETKDGIYLKIEKLNEYIAQLDKAINDENGMKELNIDFKAILEKLVEIIKNKVTGTSFVQFDFLNRAKNFINSGIDNGKANESETIKIGGLNIKGDLGYQNGKLTGSLNIFGDKKEQEEPVVQEPVVQQPVVQEPIVQQPVVQQPIVQEPIIQQPVVQEPIVQIPQQPVVQQPVSQQPIVQQPIFQVPQQPIVQQPVIQQPIVQEPVVQEPIVQQPIVQQPQQPQQPVVQQPIVQQPVVQQPIVQQPVVQVPQQPIVQQPIIQVPQQSVVQQPIVQQPVIEQQLPLLDDVIEQPTPIQQIITQQPIIQQQIISQPQVPLHQQIIQPQIPVEIPQQPIAPLPQQTITQQPIIQEPIIEMEEKTEEIIEEGEDLFSKLISTLKALLIDLNLYKIGLTSHDKIKEKLITLKTSFEETKETLENELEPLIEQEKFANECIANQEKIIDEAIVNVDGNQKLQDASAQLCKEFGQDFVNHGKQRAANVHALGELLKEIRNKIDHMPENIINKYREAVEYFKNNQDKVIHVNKYFQ